MRKRRLARLLYKHKNNIANQITKGENYGIFARISTGLWECFVENFFNNRL